MRAPWLPLALLALLAATLAPLAAADHAYSHRLLVFGRVVDAAGVPVDNVTVSLFFSGLSAEGPCVDQPGTSTEAFGPMRTRPTTDASGDFMFCHHVHAMSRTAPGEALLRANVLGENVTARVALDPFFRASHVVLRGNETMELRPEPGQGHVVAARVWRPAPEGVTVEGVRVHGTTVNQVPVNVTVESGNMTARRNGTTNNYGDVALEMDIPLAAKTGRVIVEVLGETYEAPLAPEGVTFLKVNVGDDAPAPATPTAATPDPSPRPTGPAPTAPTPGGGTQEAPTTPTLTPDGGEAEVPLPAALALGALALAARLLTRRSA